MGLSLGKRIAIFFAAAAVVCSCDQHKPGEYPEVQRDKIHDASPSPAAEESQPASSPSPPAKPTPAEFFPTKPR
jgi:hypothetical protein